MQKETKSLSVIEAMLVIAGKERKKERKKGRKKGRKKKCMEEMSE